MTAFLSDSFTDVDGTLLQSHTPEVGGAWVYHSLASSANAEITDANRVRTSGGTTVYYNNVTPPKADYSVKATMYVASTLASDAGVLARVSSSAADYYMMRLGISAGTVQVYKSIGGTFTLLGSRGIAAPAAGSSYTIELRVNGTTITGYHNEIEYVSVTDSSLSGAGYAGIRELGSLSDTTGHHWDALTATDPSTDTASAPTIRVAHGVFALSRASLVVNKPLGIQDGDLWLVAINQSGNTAITAPAGWTFWGTVLHSIGAAQLDIWFRVAASEPSSYSWTFASTLVDAWIATIMGEDQATPIGASGSTPNQNGVTNVVAPGVTTVANNALLIGFFAMGGTRTFTPPGSMTERVDIGSGPALMVATETQPTAGATGNKTAVSNSVGNGGAALLAIKAPTAGASHPLAGEAAGSSFAAVSRLQLAQPLQGSSQGSSVALAQTLQMGHALQGLSAGSSFAQASAIQESHPLAGSSQGSSLATGTRLQVSHPLQGSALGSSSVQANLTTQAAGAALAGISQGSSFASATGLQLAQPLQGVSLSGSLALAGGLRLSHPMAGVSAGSSHGVVSRLLVEHQLAGESQGNSQGLASYLSLAHLLEGVALGESWAEGTLGRKVLPAILLALLKGRPLLVASADADLIASPRSLEV